eukprot:CAMPEP_0180137684 /NCGR_PEP_ID=MMETSP0986-20121125/12388_1 /TAXON_ID=697907 /ORGANISM="non described non described, Strain CCMP2293" /LENGTH=154 /DNA_ID=CAMNT_0022079251 /DNA_START=36 /DNA_END=500 /DNA_ORIENTATION=-
MMGTSSPPLAAVPRLLLLSLALLQAASAFSPSLSAAPLRFPARSLSAPRPLSLSAPPARRRPATLALAMQEVPEEPAGEAKREPLFKQERTDDPTAPKRTTGFKNLFDNVKKEWEENPRGTLIKLVLLSLTQPISLYIGFQVFTGLQEQTLMPK